MEMPNAKKWLKPWKMSTYVDICVSFAVHETLRVESCTLYVSVPTTASGLQGLKPLVNRLM